MEKGQAHKPPRQLDLASAAFVSPFSVASIQARQQRGHALLEPAWPRFNLENQLKEILMSKGRQAFRRNDLTRAIKGAIAAGVEIAKAEIEPDTGKIVLMFGKSVASSTADIGEQGGWDQL